MGYSVLSVLSVLFMVLVIPIVVLTYNRKITFFKGLFTSTAAMLMSFVASVLSYNTETGKNLIDLYISESFSGMADVFGSISADTIRAMFGNISADQAEIARANLLSALDVMKDIYTIMLPSVIILTLLTLSYILFMIVKSILRLLKKDVTMYPMFSQLKLTKGATLALGISLFFSTFSHDLRIANAFLNIAVIILGVGFVCGFSFIDYNIRKRVDNLWVRLLVYISVIFVVSSVYTLATYAVISISIFDSFFNFRRLRLKEGKNG